MQLLNGWDKIWFQLTCYELAPGFVLSGFNGVDLYTAAFDMGNGVTYAFEDTLVGCQQHEFLVESQFYMLHDTNQGYFRARCAAIQEKPVEDEEDEPSSVQTLLTHTAVTRDGTTVV